MNIFKIGMIMTVVVGGICTLILALGKDYTLMSIVIILTALFFFISATYDAAYGPSF